MVKLEDYNLALGVVNNIIVIDSADTIVFAGDDIKTILFENKGELEKNLLDNFQCKEERELLEKKIKEVREKRHTSEAEFNRLSKTIFIFPGNYGKNHDLILSTKKQLLMANKIAFDLKERVKELKCLFNISNNIHSARNLQEALEKSVKDLGGGFQFPELARSRIQVNGNIYGDDDCLDPGKTGNILSQDIIVNGNKKRGTLQVCYREHAGFLEEEKNLIREISSMLAQAIEKFEAKQDLEKHTRILDLKNKKLLELTEECGQSRQNLQALFNTISDKIVVIDRDFNIELSNKDEIGNSGKCYKKLFSSSNSCENCPAITAFSSGETASLEKKNANSYHLLQVYPIFNNRGEVERVLEISRDITEEKQMKSQLLQSYKLASIGKLVAGVAHEINNPNTFIRGNIKIIDEAFKDILPILDEYAKDRPELKIARLKYNIFRENIPILVDDMASGTDRIKKIVDGLKNFARKDEGLHTDEVDINHLIQNNLRITEKEVRKHAKFKLNLEPGVPKFKGNIQQLEQVMMNMLLNAAQAIEGENGLIFIETNYNKKAGEVIVKIGDNGRGMDDKTKQNIFDPFFTTKRDKGGTGLGLSISYGIIKEHKGKIDVESSPGAGTTFTIRIPAQNVKRENQTR